MAKYAYLWGTAKNVRRVGRIDIPGGGQVVVENGRAYFQVGGAVVYDSDPESEDRETLDKARALMDALNAPAAIER